MQNEFYVIYLKRAELLRIKNNKNNTKFNLKQSLNQLFYCAKTPSQRKLLINDINSVIDLFTSFAGLQDLC